MILTFPVKKKKKVKGEKNGEGGEYKYKNCPTNATKLI